MKTTNRATILWCIASVVILLCIAAAVLCGLTGRSATLVDGSILTEPARQVLECARSGDFEALGRMLYGAPRLDSPRGEGSGAEDLLWDAYLQSVCYHFPGTYTQSDEVLELDVQITCLDLAAVLDRMDSLELIRTDSREAVLYHAAAGILAEDPPSMRQDLKLQLVRAAEGWQVVPTVPLQRLLSGFVTQ